ncbi:YwqI/YxiC family protein [Bacillus sp. A301a_S52]|jgi:type VII secretion effector (TIGR04197 family)|nr:YwqI/YxiC family protein [Bacillus sp. A301a_S52]
MGEILVNPQLVDQLNDGMSTSITNLQDSATLKSTDMEKTVLDSIAKYETILTEFEEVLALYVQLMEKDIATIDTVKNTLIAEDNRLADWRIFTK